jgi:hypothetical protein
MPTQSLRLLAQACLGVLVGALLALAIVRLAFPPNARPVPLPDEFLPWITHIVWAKPREKGFYLLSLVLGGTCGYLATRKILPGRVTALWLWSTLILAVPIGNLIIARTFADASFVIPALTAIVIGGALAALIHRRGEPLAVVARPLGVAPDDRSTHWSYLVILAVMTLVLIPSSFAAVAARISLNVHPVIFVFGPALYFLGNGLLPGTDYYSLYSIGFPWLFHFVMGDSSGQALVSYVIIVIVASWLFYAHLVHLLQWLYRSWIAAATVAFIPLILGFVYTPSGAPFVAPSSSILRYPLLTVCALLTGLWAEAPAWTSRLVPIAVASGLAIFLETESGIVMLIAAPLAIFLTHPWQSRVIPPVLAFFAISVASFAVMLVAVFGPGVFHLEFFRRLFDGVVAFGRLGFNGRSASWALHDWNWLYNVVAPGAMLATAAVVARASSIDASDRRRSAALAFLAVSGLMLLAKYVNQSAGAVWQMSSVGPFSILGWWCMVLLRRIDPGLIAQGATSIGIPNARAQSLGQRAYTVRGAVGAGFVCLAVVFLLTASQGPPNRAVFGLHAWANFPSLLKRPFSRPQACAQTDCLPNPADAADVALITSNTRPGQQVAIVGDPYDWTYLLAARRPPLMYFMPSADIFTRSQLAESLKRLDHADYLFVPKGPNGEPNIQRTDLSAAVSPLLGTVFRKDGEGERLAVWKRVTVENTSGTR